MADGKNRYDTLESLYYHLSPINSGQLSDDPGVNQSGSLDVLRRLILDPRGIFHGWNSISKEIESHFKITKGKDQNELEKAKKELGKSFHIISSNRWIDLGDADYWGKKNYGIEKICSYLTQNKLQESGVDNVSIFVSRDPMLSPAIKGVDAVETFLNYIPTVIASQMVPYLDVEFEITNPLIEKGKEAVGTFGTGTPSIMRFLLGTGDVLKSASSTNKALITPDVQLQDTEKDNKRYTTRRAYSGMELFLMPQTLTNMEGLEPIAGNRLVRVKPFLPFMSIEGFDVSIANAGAGSFSHKKGNLKMKMHDKSRISEFAEFIRSGGFSNTLVWTTYGWIAPLGRTEGGPSEPLDAYADFVNKNMVVRDCWQPVNTQFSFDGSGQVSFTLELVTKGTRQLQRLRVSRTTGDDNLENQLDKLNNLIHKIGEMKKKIDTTQRFSVSIAANEVLNAASTTGNLVDLKDVKDLMPVINQLIKSMDNSGSFKSEDVKSFKDALNELAAQGSGGLYQKANKDASTYVQNRLEALKTDDNSPDPFLPSPNEYFNSDVLDAIRRFTDKETYAKYQADIAKKIDASKGKINKLELTSSAAVVSFGKLFMNFILPAIVGSKASEEVQVFFYGLNDQCGPLSGLSVAEFPVNMVTFAYAYSEAIKSLRTSSLTLEQFMKLVIDTQFMDPRSIGYGMMKMYDAPDPGSEEKKLNESSKELEQFQADWASKWGSLKFPVIEIFIESGRNDEAPDGSEIIKSLKSGAKSYSKDPVEVGGIVKRIHIYDKQCNPHKLLQQVIEGRDGLEAGDIDGKKIEGILNQMITKAQKNKIKEALQKDKNISLRAAAESAGVDVQKIENDPRFFDTIKRPGGVEHKIPRDRERFKSELMRYVPKILIGTNGTLISNASVASKTDGLMGAINIMNAHKAITSTASTSSTTLEDPGHLPLTTHPVTISITSMGVPIASLYQTFFIDFDTGTSIDNVYNCTQINHSIAQGKFTTSWTFAPSSNGYGKFSSPPSVAQMVSKAINPILDALSK